VIEPNPPIYFARHGETDWNRDQRIQGQIDTVLNDLGHRQSEVLARGLRSRLKGETDLTFVASPLMRARQTMGYVARAFDIEEQAVRIEPSLMELSFGAWEGRYFRELKSDPAYPKDPVERFRWRPVDGESYADGMERLKQWIGRLDSPTVIVSHGAIGRCLIALVSDLSPQETLTQPTPQGFFCRLKEGLIEWFDAATGYP
jgi:probable phosphoglycerate mutase